VKRSLRALWFIYGVTAFFVVVILCLPFYFLAFLIFGEQAARPLIWFSHRVVSRVCLWLMLIRKKVHGLEHVDNQRHYVFISNHQSSIDILLNAVTAPFLFKFLAKQELIKIPFFGYAVRKMCVLVNRKNPASRQESFDNMKKALAAGFSIYIAPEGTRNRTEEALTKFYDGAFRLAIETDTPLLVQTLTPPCKLNNPNYKMDLSPGIVHCYFAPPIETTDLTLDDIPSLKEQVRQMMLTHLNSCYSYKSLFVRLVDPLDSFIRSSV